MKITKLKIEQFLAITEAELSLADRGLILVQGINSVDSSALSNGAGKSSIADALCWAIYGTTARGESGDAVVNRNAGKGTRVEVQLVEPSGVAYTIVRHRKHKTGKNNLHVFVDEGAGPRDLTKGTDKLTQEVADKVIGASLDVFKGSIYAGQEQMPDLPAMNDKALKVLIEEAAGVTAIEEAYKLAREGFAAAKGDYELAKMELSNAESTLSIRESALEAGIGSEKNWLVQRDQEVKAEADAVRDTLLPEITRLKAEGAKEDLRELTKQVEVLDAQIAAVNDEQAEYRRLTGLAAKAAGTAASLTSNATRAENLIVLRKEQLAEVENMVGKPCGTCGRPMTEAELGAAKAKAQADLEHAEMELTAAQRFADKADAEAKKLHEDANAFNASMTDLSKTVMAKSVLVQKIIDLKDLNRQISRLEIDARDKVAQIKAKKNAPSPFASQIEALRKQIEHDQKEVERTRNEVDSKVAAVMLESEVVKVFAPAGVRSRILDEITPYLNAQTGKYLSIMSDGNLSAEWSTITRTAKGEAREKFAIDVTSTTAAESFKGLSGGEKRKVRVATALALQDLVATRATKPIDLFIGDEIDDALDASGLERLMIILEEKASERGTVMVISHNSLRDEIRQVIQVEKRADGTTEITETMA